MNKNKEEAMRIKWMQAEHDRLTAKGVNFTTPVTSVTGSVIAVLDDTCGNLIQLVHLTWG
jgi:predicted enzyme related to lactoylglutathione lyase